MKIRKCLIDPTDGCGPCNHFVVFDSLIQIQCNFRVIWNRCGLNLLYRRNLPSTRPSRRNLLSTRPSREIIEQHDQTHIYTHTQLPILFLFCKQNGHYCNLLSSGSVQCRSSLYKSEYSSLKVKRMENVRFWMLSSTHPLRPFFFAKTDRMLVGSILNSCEKKNSNHPAPRPNSRDQWKLVSLYVCATRQNAISTFQEKKKLFYYKCLRM